MKLTYDFFYFYLFTEIAKVRSNLFQVNGHRKEPLILPEPDGEVTTLTEKVFVPVKDHPDVSKKLHLLFSLIVYLLYGGR